MKKMVHLMHSDGLGGGPVVVNQLVRDFSKDFEVIAIVGGKGKVTDACRKAGVAVYSIGIDRLWKCSYGFFQLFFLLRKIRPQVLFLHGQWAGPLGALAGKWAGVPVMIYITHSPAFYHRQTFKNVIRGYYSEIIPCQLSDAVVALSEGNRNQYLLRQWVKENRLYMIHNGLDLDENPPKESKEAIRARLNWNNAQRHILFLGRLDHQKGLAWLLPAWKLVIKDRPSANLWVIGSGPQEEEVRRLAVNLGLGESCHFLPDQSNAQDFIEASDAVVLSSLYEGHALVPLETMAAGRAFVGTKADGIVDSIRDGVEGFLVMPGDYPALALALGKVIDSPDLSERLGKAGLQRIRAFNWKFSFRKYEVLVQELLQMKAQ